MDLLSEKSALVAGKVAGGDDIRSETGLLMERWKTLEGSMSSRVASVTEVGEMWKHVEQEYRKADAETTRIRDTLINVDPAIRSKNQLVESLTALRVSFPKKTPKTTDFVYVDIRVLHLRYRVNVEK